MIAETTADAEKSVFRRISRHNVTLTVIWLGVVGVVQKKFICVAVDAPRCDRGPLGVADPILSCSNNGHTSM